MKLREEDWMAERFSGAVLQPTDENVDIPRSLGEIGLNSFAPYRMNRLMAR